MIELLLLLNLIGQVIIITYLEKNAHKTDKLLERKPHYKL